ncbi:hypothetical protein ACLOJK_038278 [Asimina triloba]
MEKKLEKALYRPSGDNEIVTPFATKDDRRRGIFPKLNVLPVPNIQRLPAHLLTSMTGAIVGEFSISKWLFLVLRMGIVPPGHLPFTRHSCANDATEDDVLLALSSVSSLGLI